MLRSLNFRTAGYRDSFLVKHSTYSSRFMLTVIIITPWVWRAVTKKQGGLGNKKIYLGSDFFLRTLQAGLPTYVIRHISIYGNMTSSTQVLRIPDAS